MASRVVWALLFGAAAGLSPTLANAQGYFQYFSSGPPQYYPSPRPYPDAGRYNPYQPYDSGPYDRPTTYRTLCVRTCDGYYFPISFSTTRSEFAHDADKCTASCGSQARLFYHPNPGGTVEDMVDLTGFGYADMPNAFKYRKSLVNGCGCRPQPWSEAERARHQSYVRSEQPTERVPEYGNTAAARDRKPSTVDDAPDRPRSSVYDEPLGNERPRPVSRYVLPSPPQRNGNLFGAPFSPKRGSPAGLFR
jgi:uncharacterized protein DUF2865